MLDIALILICLSMILHFRRHWVHITRDMMEERRYERMKSSIDWTTLKRNPELGSNARGSALGRV